MDLHLLKKNYDKLTTTGKICLFQLKKIFPN